MNWVTVLAFTSLTFLLEKYVESRSGYVSEVYEKTKFLCDVAKRKSFKARSEIQCIHKCAKETMCELINYKPHKEEDGNGNNCEIFNLPHNHLSCTMSRNEANWKALVFWDAKNCLFTQRHFCFPCKCQGNCTTQGLSTCSCDLVQLPNLLVTFESRQGTVMFERGVDKNSHSSVLLVGSASIVPSIRRGGNILDLPNKYSRAVIGDFHGIRLNNPRNTDFTVSLWLKVNDVVNSDCTVIASGRSNVDTGLNIILKDMAKVISAEIIAYDRYVSLSHVVGTSLEVWTHLALLHIDSTSGTAAKLFVNGILVESTNSLNSNNAKTGQFGTLEMGTHSGNLFPVTGDGCGIQLDDLAVWYSVLSDEQLLQLVSRGDEC